MTPDPSPSPTRLMIPSPGPTTWDVIAQWVAIGILIACTVAVIFFVFNYLPKVKKIKPFYASIAAVAILGGVFAFLLPVAFNSGFGKDDDGRVLRQLILYTTGGVLGVITIGETHRKNNQEKEKNENDHTRQVYAERRSRYTKAVEQLANENAAVRFGGIYTLAGLVDEWLTDKSIKEENDRRKEGQVIINNLCAYIRSPFPLAALRRDLDKYASLTEDDIEKPNNNPRVIFLQEQEIRLAIFTEISKRLENSTNNLDNTSAIWNKFKYDFREADIFYPLGNLHFSSPDFSGAKFYGAASFISSNFSGKANFYLAHFEGITAFLDATFEGLAEFSNATFMDKCSFAGVSFTAGANFNRSYYDMKPLFKDKEEGKTHQARFSAHADLQEHNFETRKGSQPIPTRKAELNGAECFIPMDAVLFDPISGETSDPAKPLDKSNDSEEEMPAE